MSLGHSVSGTDCVRRTALTPGVTIAIAWTANAPIVPARSSRLRRGLSANMERVSERLAPTWKFSKRTSRRSTPLRAAASVHPLARNVRNMTTPPTPITRALRSTRSSMSRLKIGSLGARGGR